MKIPEFNRTDDFLGYVDIPCLFAKVKNSELPGVAFRHIAECEEDPDCDIYLRGRKLDKISPWQQEILTQIFEKDGLAAAVTEAMKEYETSPKWAGEGYVHLAEEDRQKIKEHGIAPYITISVIVIDEVRRKVILRADIAKSTPGTQSLMPVGLESVLKAQDIADLLAWMRAR